MTCPRGRRTRRTRHTLTRRGGWGGSAVTHSCAGKESPDGRHHEAERQAGGERRRAQAAQHRRTEQGRGEEMTWLEGKKTYLVALGMLVYAMLGWYLYGTP